VFEPWYDGRFPLAGQEVQVAYTQWRNFGLKSGGTKIYPPSLPLPFFPLSLFPSPTFLFSRGLGAEPPVDRGPGILTPEKK